MKISKTFRLDERVTDKLKKAAEKQRRSEANVVENALAKELKVKL